MKYTVTIQGPDASNPQTLRTCRLYMEVPFSAAGTTTDNGKFKALDYGCIVPTIGGCFANVPVPLYPVTICLTTDGGSTTGITIVSMFDSLGCLNASGRGYLEQRWASGIQAGNLNWTASSGGSETTSTNAAVASADSGSGGDDGSADA